APPAGIAGRWLAVLELRPVVTENQVAASGGAVVVRTFEVTESDGALVVTLHRGQLSDDLKSRIDPRSVPKKRSAAGAAPSPGGATAQAGAANGGAALEAPDQAALADVARAWPNLLAPDNEPRAVASEVIAYDMVSDEDKKRLGAPGTNYFIVFNEGYPETSTAPRQSVTTLAVQKLESGRMSGKALQALVLPGRNRGDLAFPPVPATLEGGFAAFRVPDSADAAPAAAPGAAAPAAAPPPAKADRKPGLFEGLFSGCSG